MKPFTFQFVLQAESPIAHHEGVRGNIAYLMSRKVRQPDGAFEAVPCITSDTMRHGMRETGAILNLQGAGLLGDGKSPELSEGALRLLFNGGMLTGRGDASVVKLETYRKIADLLPVVGLLGGCADAMVIPGKVQVRDAMLVCEEYAHRLPAWVREHLDGQQVLSWRDQKEDCQRVRMDPTRDPHKKGLLSAAAQASLDARLLGKDKAHEEGDDREPAKDRGRPMPRTYEAIMEGSLWYWEISGTTYSALDESALYAILAVFLLRNRVGGKKGTGHGRLSAVKGHAVEVPFWQAATLEADMQALADQRAPDFFRHLRERATEVVDLLAKVDA